MKTPAYHLWLGDKVQATYREYGVVTAEWIDSVLGSTLLQMKGLRFDGRSLQRFFDGQQTYLEQRVEFFTADSAMKYDARQKRMRKAEDWDLAVEAMNDAQHQFLEILADIEFCDPKLERLNPPIPTGWKRMKAMQYEILRAQWWKEYGLRATRLYVTSSLVHLRELSMEDDMITLGPKRINWLYGVVADSLQEYYRLFFAGNPQADDRIRARIDGMHRIMGASGIEFTTIKAEGIDTIVRPAEQDDPVMRKRRAAQPEPHPELLPEAYRSLLEETKKGGRIPV